MTEIDRRRAAFKVPLTGGRSIEVPEHPPLDPIALPERWPSLVEDDGGPISLTFKLAPDLRLRLATNRESCGGWYAALVLERDVGTFEPPDPKVSVSESYRAVVSGARTHAKAIRAVVAAAVEAGFVRLDA